MIQFTDKEKIRLFDMLAEKYYNKNFGSFSKSDIDVLMFSTYMEHCVTLGNDYSDYSVSKELGITQNRVRTLKEKKELQYPTENFDWKSKLAEELTNAKFDEQSRTVKVFINDVNVQIEFRNFIEQHGWYDDFSLNKKLCVIPLSGFIDIFGSDVVYDCALAEKIKEVCKDCEESKSESFKKFISKFSKEATKSFLKTASTELVKSILNAIPFVGIAKVGIDALIGIINKH